MIQLLMAILAAVSVLFGCREQSGKPVENETVIASEIEEQSNSLVREIEDTDFGEETRAKSQVLETVEAAKSKDVTCEADTIILFAERGFGKVSIATTYDMDGNYFEECEADPDSDEKHPLYSAYYIGQDGYIWLIYSCNGEFSAWPASYVLSGQTGRDVLVSEHEYVMSYDSETNCFYKLIPDTEGCMIVEVPTIDAAMLDQLAEGMFGL